MNTTSSGMERTGVPRRQSHVGEGALGRRSRVGIDELVGRGYDAVERDDLRRFVPQVMEGTMSSLRITISASNAASSSTDERPPALRR